MLRTYDSFGDRTAQTAISDTPPTPTLTFSGNNSRADQLCYDSAGDMLDGSPCNQVTLHNYAYDAEGRLLSSNSSLYKYVYDADGLRVAKQNNGGSTTNEYLYDLTGNMTVEVNGSGAVLRQELYTGDRHIATYGSGGVGQIVYTHTNWLGTEAARSDGSGALCFTATSLPFGDNLNVAGTCNPSLKILYRQRKRHRIGTRLHDRSVLCIYDGEVHES